eukprot:TRINITY_DN4473_c0_g1_i10.p1 TRINITY_DN4473_c0_g1~~TRINITY_DN4473_c0_g1_i10.p1  ORF type:complete len:190 (+),score=45.20 TRINITY_DN4473_c0_g1_i10:159-728(+)
MPWLERTALQPAESVISSSTLRQSTQRDTMRCVSVLLLALAVQTAAAGEVVAPVAATAGTDALTKAPGSVAEVETKEEASKAEVAGAADVAESDPSGAAQEAAVAEESEEDAMTKALAGTINVQESVEPEGDAATERYLAATPAPTSAPTSSSNTTASSVISGAMPKAESAAGTTFALLCSMAGLIYVQ